MDNTIFIYKTNGFYFGFIKNGFLFSRDGIYLGWVEGDFVWDLRGKFRGAVTEVAGHNYILLNRLSIAPAPRIPKAPLAPEMSLTPQSNIAPVSLSPELVDGFNGN